MEKCNLCNFVYFGQEITRTNKGWALDSVVLCSEVTKWMKDDITSPPVEGVYVYGLYLEGAGWDRRNMRLTESKPKVLFEMMPVIRIYAENNSKWLYCKECYFERIQCKFLFNCMEVFWALGISWGCCYSSYTYQIFFNRGNFPVFHIKWALSLSW